jgi:glutamine amidotransferase
MKKLYIINYNAGNITSILNACGKVAEQNWQICITQDPSELSNADSIIVPGVGAFDDCINSLIKLGFQEPLKKHCQNKKPLLGICVGMQIFADYGNENAKTTTEKTAGLGLIAGEVKKITPDSKEVNKIKLPQMGWNNVDFATNSLGNYHPIFNKLPSDQDFYFANSYHFLAKEQQNIIATARYGGIITAAVAKENICGIQFHPEKSGTAGLQILANFLDL